MATKVKATFDIIDNTKDAAIITVAASIGIMYSIVTKKSVLQTLGITVLFALGGGIVSIVYTNLTTNE